MDTLLHDLRYAVRQLLLHRTFTIVAALTLALGIGANTAIFSVVYGVLLRPLPYPRPQELVGLGEAYQGGSGEMGVTYREFQFLAEQGGVFNSVAAMTSVGMNLGVNSEAEHLHGQRVSRDFFRVLAVSAVIGRTFAAEEDQVNGPAVLVLSYPLWQRRFGGDPAIIGRAHGPARRQAGHRDRCDAGHFCAAGAGGCLEHAGAGRIDCRQWRESRGDRQDRPGHDGGAGQSADAALAFADFQVRFKEMGLPAQLTMQLAPFKALTSLDVRTPVMILFGAIGFVLLIACANVASLILGRAAARQRELSVRVALGATHRRIMRQILTESLVLSCIGGALAVGVATWAVHGLVAFVPSDLAGGADVRLDGWALLFTFAVALLTGVIFGIVPAWLTASADPQAALQAGSTRATGSVRQGKLRNALVIAEFAMSVILLAGAGLMIRTFANLMHTEAGFDTRHTLSAEIWLTGSRYDSPSTVAAYYQTVVTRLQATPGVAAAAVVEAGLPLERGGNISVSRGSERLHGGIDYRTVTPGYFRTLGVPVRQGREFAVADDAGAVPVIVVNEAFLRQRYLAGEVLGQDLIVGGGSTVPRAIVGVVGDVKSFVGFPAPPTVFLPSAQTPFDLTRIFNGWFPIHVMVRAAGDPASLAIAVARVLHDVDPEVPVGRVQPMAGVLDASLALQRFVMLLLSAFAALAIMLAVVGIYGLISWFVVRSTRDIGVRVALGARPADVMALVLRRGMGPGVRGCVIGLLGAVALTRLLAGLLFNVAPADPLTLVAVTACCSARWRRRHAISRRGGPRGSIRSSPCARSRGAASSGRSDMNRLMQDIRYAVRGLIKTPAFTLGVVVTLALGIGINAVMFGVVDTLFLRAPAGVARPDGIVRVYYQHRSRSFGDRITGASSTFPSYTDLARRRARSRAGHRLYTTRRRSDWVASPAIQVNAAVTSFQFFPMLGLRPSLGRFFTDAEDRVGGDRVAVLTWHFWQRQFGGDPAIIGRALAIGKGTYTVIGVGPRDFAGIDLGSRPDPADSSRGRG